MQCATVRVLKNVTAFIDCRIADNKLIVRVPLIAQAVKPTFPRRPRLVVVPGCPGSNAGRTARGNMGTGDVFTELRCGQYAFG